MIVTVACYTILPLYTVYKEDWMLTVLTHTDTKKSHNKRDGPK